MSENISEKPYDNPPPDEELYKFDYQKSALATEQKAYNSLQTEIAGFGDNYNNLSNAFDEEVTAIISKYPDNDDNLSKVLYILNKINIPNVVENRYDENELAVLNNIATNFQREFQTVLNEQYAKQEPEQYQRILIDLLKAKKSTNTFSRVKHVALSIVRAIILNYLRDKFGNDLRNNWSTIGQTRIEYGGKTRKSRKSKKSRKSRKSRKSKTSKKSRKSRK